MSKLALYTPIFQQQSSWLGAYGLNSRIQDSLDTWQLIWNARSDIYSIQALESKPVVESWKRVGFFQHADEWRSFSVGILKLLQAEFRRTSGLGSRGSSLSTPFSKFDESSMDQVARVLYSLQTCGFG